jgi:hypothetical protein
METSKIKNFPDAKSAWLLFVDDYVEVFVRALSKLQKYDKEKSVGEDELSEMLAAGLLEQSCREILDETKIHLDIPQWERHIPPDHLQNLRNGQLGKRPDFTCVCPNLRPGRHENYEFYLHIECKLLGKRTENPKNYVIEGIKRFDNNEHQYGKNAWTGFMIGYIVGELPNILQEKVNISIDKYIIQHGHLQMVFGSERISQSTHSFVRQYTKPSDFSIVHIWVDLRE